MTQALGSTIDAMVEFIAQLEDVRRLEGIGAGDMAAMAAQLAAEDSLRRPYITTGNRRTDLIKAAALCLCEAEQV